MKHMIRLTLANGQVIERTAAGTKQELREFLLGHRLVREGIDDTITKIEFYWPNPDIDGDNWHE